MSDNRRRLTDEKAIFLGLELKTHDKGRNTARYALDERQLNQLNQMAIQPNERFFVNTQNKLDKDGNVISSVEKLQSEPIEVPEGFEIVKISTSKTTGQQWVQYKPKEGVNSFSESFLENTIKKYSQKIKVRPVEFKTDFDFDCLTYTDLHIGMNPDPTGNAMYAENWSEDEILSTAQDIVNHTLTFRRSDVLVVDELGDFLDGFDGYTTRRGHKLPQNMTNEQMFDVGLKFKLLILDCLAPKFKSIKFNNICNDNHAGSFGYFVNSAYKQMAEHRYENIEVNNPRTFLSHYFQGDVCFVISHGKDDSTLKFGFKPHLDAKQIEKIDQYLKQNKIYNKAKRIIFKKGDSHQLLFDMCGSDDFDYFNYAASSPSSQWVQNNFKKGRRGFVIDNFIGTLSSTTPIFF